MSRGRGVLYGVCGLLSYLAFACSTYAAWTWDGGGSFELVTIGENWNPDAVPFFNTGNTTANTDSSLIFTGNIQTSPIFGSADHFNGITFDANADPFDLIGG